MTKNQIEYLKLQETQRANQRQEALTASRDEVAKQLGFGNLAETSRHNLATEQHAYAVLGESQRHNLAQEAHNSALLSETSRHNMVLEGIQNEQLDISRDQLAESKRHSMAVELETSTHNRATEYETWRSNLAREQETYRSNLAREVETNRANVARETETRRSNLASETARSKELQFQYSSLAEQSRYHDMSVSLGYSQLAETKRANLAHEIEVNRSNVAREAENTRSNVARESETQRHNQQTEAQAEKQRQQQGYQFARNLSLEQRKTDLRTAELEEVKSHNSAMESQGWVTSIAKAAEPASKLIPLFIGG